jgi:pyruvate dehydrogenase E1 component
VQLLASGPILQEALRAQAMLAEKFDVAAAVWSATSFQQLRNDALDADRWNRLHPDGERRVPYVTECLAPSEGPVVAATDYLKALPDLVSRWIERPYTVLGTDGFGRSDTREALRTHFEVNAEHIAYAALYGLCLDGASTPDELRHAIGELGIDPDRVNPLFA